MMVKTNARKSDGNRNEWRKWAFGELRGTRSIHGKPTKRSERVIVLMRQLQFDLDPLFQVIVSDLMLYRDNSSPAMGFTVFCRRQPGWNHEHAPFSLHHHVATHRRLFDSCWFTIEGIDRHEIQQTHFLSLAVKRLNTYLFVALMFYLFLLLSSEVFHC